MSAAAVVEQSIATFALHALWQLPLLAGATWAAVRVGRPQAKTAHALWVATLVLCVLLPVGSTIAARRAALAAERDAQVSILYNPQDYEGSLPSMQRLPAWKRVLHRHLNAQDGLQPFAVAVPPHWARAIAAGWLLAAIFFGSQLAIGFIRIRALVRAASNRPLPPMIAAKLRQQSERLHMRAPATKLHGGIAGPVLAGVVKPTLLLPADSVDELSENEIEAVLAHELAHLRRRDPAVHAACALLLLPVCFHPAALWVARSVRQTREMACDAEAAERMGSPANYAWALLQVAERTNTDRRHGAAAALFTNGLFGAGLQLFTNRGAMEERMQSLMDGNGSRVRGRAVRAAAGVSLAAVAMVAATMLQVQPTLAAERSLQTAGATQQVPGTPAASSTSTAQDNGPALMGGEHAREQLRRAQHQLTQAQSRATTAEDRKKIEGAQQAIAVAEQALAAADGTPRFHFDSSEFDRQMKNFELPDDAAFQARMAKQRDAMAKMQAQFNSPEWKAQMQQLQRQAMEAAQAQMNSPEVKVQMDAARKFDRAKVEASMAQARAQQEKAMEQMRSGAIQRQIEAARLIARNELPAPLPPPFASSASDAAQQGSDRTIKVSAGVMAGNKIGGSNPVYPPAAKEKHIQGAVVLHAIIDKAGHVETIQLASSPDDQLSKAAVEAVQTWIYKPYLLNGDPTAVDTTITVNFSLMP